jgi:hypothetical protein
MCIRPPACLINRYIKKTDQSLKYFKRITSVFSLNHKSLFEQKLLSFTLQLSLVYFFLFGLMSWWGSSPDIGHEAFNDFISISKLPLGILSITAALIIFIARAHGTVQTTTQITELFRKNNSDGYQNQKNDFLTYFKNSDIGIRTYSHFFPSTIQEGPSPPNEELILKEKLEIGRSLGVMRSIYIEHSHTDRDLDFYYRQAINALTETQQSFTIPTFQKALKNNHYYYSKKDKIETDNSIQYKKYPLISMKALVESLIELTNTHNQLCEYTHSSHNINNDDPSLMFTTSLLSQIKSKALPMIDKSIDSINAKCDMTYTIEVTL